MTSQNLPKNEKEWEEKLGDRYKYLREKATETPFTGELLTNKADGVYLCGGCGAELFDAKAKYDSGSGWPSFWDVVQKGVVDLVSDNTPGMTWSEVVCATCRGHLGHLFPDGPTNLTDGSEATGMRYCINSAALDFRQRALR